MSPKRDKTRQNSDNKSYCSKPASDHSPDNGAHIDADTRAFRKPRWPGIFCVAVTLLIVWIGRRFIIRIINAEHHGHDQTYHVDRTANRHVRVRSLLGFEGCVQLIRHDALSQLECGADHHHLRTARILEVNPTNVPAVLKMVWASPRTQFERKP